MTDREFDRLAGAWLDLMPSEAPDRVIASVLQAVDATPQVRRAVVPAPWRNTPLNRFSYPAAAVVLVAIIAGGSLILSNFRGSAVGGPGATPSATVPAETPLIQGHGAGMGYPTGAPQEMTESTWIADGNGISSLVHDARIKLDTGADGRRIAVTYVASTAPQISQPVTAAPGTLAVVTTAVGARCNVGDYGEYAVVPGSDGLTVTLRLISEACDTRGALLARTWTRSHDTGGRGGPGVVTAFSPMLQITLPPANYRGSVGTDGAAIDSPTRSLVAVKDPLGVSTPCAAGPGPTKLIAPNSNAFLAYLRTLPGFDVRTSPFTIDGRVGVRVTIPVAITAACEATGQVFEWTDHTPGNRGWFIRTGDMDVIYLVDVGSDVYLLQILDDAGPITAADEQAILSTVHFLTALPTSG